MSKTGEVPTCPTPGTSVCLVLVFVAIIVGLEDDLELLIDVSASGVLELDAGTI